MIGVVDKETIVAVVDSLIERGVEIAVELESGGSINVDAENLIRWLDDPCQYEADLYGVGKEVWAEYADLANANNQCQGQTRSRKRCLNRPAERIPELDEVLRSPSLLKSPVFRYCTRHLGYK